MWNSGSCGVGKWIANDRRESRDTPGGPPYPSPPSQSLLRNSVGFPQRWGNHLEIQCRRQGTIVARHAAVGEVPGKVGNLIRVSKGRHSFVTASSTVGTFPQEIPEPGVRPADAGTPHASPEYPCRISRDTGLSQHRLLFLLKSPFAPDRTRNRL